MKRRTTWQVVAAALGCVLAANVRANTPPPPLPALAYWGPVRHCGEGFALEARAGEALVVEQSGAWLHIGRDMVGVSRLFDGYATLNPAQLRREAVIATAGGNLVRYRLFTGQAGGYRTTYLFDPGPPGSTARLEVQSRLFDGTDRDRATLARVALGDTARALCATVPPLLQPTPDRVQGDALLMRGERYPGPFTLCWAHLALDVGAGEAAMLPWDPDQHRFALFTPGLEIGVAGDFRSGTGTGSPPPDVGGSLLRLASSYTVAAGSRQGWAGNEFMRAGVPVTNRARLLANADIKAIGPDPGPGLTFSFSRPLPDAERDAVIGRVRAAAPSDHCFDPDKT